MAFRGITWRGVTRHGTGYGLPRTELLCLQLNGVVWYFAARRRNDVYNGTPPSHRLEGLSQDPLVRIHLRESRGRREVALERGLALVEQQALEAELRVVA